MVRRRRGVSHNMETKFLSLFPLAIRNKKSERMWAGTGGEMRGGLDLLNRAREQDLEDKNESSMTNFMRESFQTSGTGAHHMVTQQHWQGSWRKRKVVGSRGREGERSLLGDVQEGQRQKEKKTLISDKLCCLVIGGMGWDGMAHLRDGGRERRHVVSSMRVSKTPWRVAWE
jgi:hypothetical protein